MANERSEQTRERRSRWIEIAISIAVAALSGAATTGLSISWYLSGTLAKLQNHADEQDRRISQTEMAVGTLQTLDSAQGSQIAVGDARYAELIRRMDQFDQKFDRILALRLR